MVLVFDSRDGGIMFESNLMGTHPKFYKSAQKHFTIVHEIDLKAKVEEEDAAWDLMVDTYDGRPYAFKGALYLAWRLILRKCTGRPLPAINPWNQSGTYFCDQIYEILEKVGLKEIGVEVGMQTPHAVFEALQ